MSGIPQIISGRSCCLVTRIFFPELHLHLLDPAPSSLPLLGQKRGGAGPLQPFRSRHRRPSNDDWRSVWAVLGRGLPRPGGTSARRRGGFLWSAPLTVLRSGGLRPFLGRPRPGGQSLSARRPARLYRLCAGTDRPHLSPVLSSRANRVEALRSGGGFGTRPGQLGAHPRSRLGWEVEGGAAWDVQSDGQLLQLVQAAAGARQVGWSRRALALLAGGDSCAPRVGRGAACPRPWRMLSLPAEFVPGAKNRRT